MIVINFTFHSGAQPVLFLFFFQAPVPWWLIWDPFSISYFILKAPLVSCLTSHSPSLFFPPPLFLVPLIRCTCVLCLPLSASYCAPSCCFIPLLGFQPEPMSWLCFFLIPSRLCLLVYFSDLFTCVRGMSYLRPSAASYE